MKAIVVPTISEIRIQGFKSLAQQCKLEIRPLTILAGANGSGKSSGAPAAAPSKQTLASPSTPDVLELAGPNVCFTEFEYSGRPPAGRRKANRMSFCYHPQDAALGPRHRHRV